MRAIARIKRGAKALVSRHGAEVGMCAKVAVAVLIPGGGGLPEVIRAMCDYVGQKDANPLLDEHVLDLLGELKEDQGHVATVMERLSEQMSDVMAQMVVMARVNMSEEELKHIAEVVISNRHELVAVRQELMRLQPELSFIKEQSDMILRAQAFNGDMLSQVKDSISAALSFCAPLLIEGVPADKTHAFLQAHMTFQRCLVHGELREAVEALRALKGISASSDTVKVCEVALRAIRRDFEGAERVAETLSAGARGDARVGRMTRSVASLTRGSRQGERPIVAEVPASQGFSVGQKFGSRSWTLKSQLGRGGMGEVWQVENSYEEVGALKLMARRLIDDPIFVARFEAEIMALKRVHHPSVVEILDWGRDQGGGYFLVMELIEGSSLGSKLRGGALSMTQAKALLIMLLKGLAACHEAGVVHRDLKPDNIMLRADGSPVLIDFGIAHQEGSTAGHTQVATVVYAPPEQLRGERVGPEADLYALGQTLAECLGGWRSVPDELMSVLERLTHNLPTRRGKAEDWLCELEEPQDTETVSYIKKSLLSQNILTKLLLILITLSMALFLILIKTEEESTLVSPSKETITTERKYTPKTIAKNELPYNGPKICKHEGLLKIFTGLRMACTMGECDQKRLRLLNNDIPLENFSSALNLLEQKTTFIFKSSNIELDQEQLTNNIEGLISQLSFMMADPSNTLTFIVNEINKEIRDVGLTEKRIQSIFNVIIKGFQDRGQLPSFAQIYRFNVEQFSKTTEGEINQTSPYEETHEETQPITVFNYPCFTQMCNYMRSHQGLNCDPNLSAEKRLPDECIERVCKNKENLKPMQSSSLTQAKHKNLATRTHDYFQYPKMKRVQIDAFMHPAPRLLSVIPRHSEFTNFISLVYDLYSEHPKCNRLTIFSNPPSIIAPNFWKTAIRSMFFEAFMSSGLRRKYLPILALASRSHIKISDELFQITGENKFNNIDLKPPYIVTFGPDGTINIWDENTLYNIQKMKKLTSIVNTICR